MRPSLWRMRQDNQLCLWELDKRTQISVTWMSTLWSKHSWNPKQEYEIWLANSTSKMLWLANLTRVFWLVCLIQFNHVCDWLVFSRTKHFDWFVCLFFVFFFLYYVFSTKIPTHIILDDWSLRKCHLNIFLIDSVFWFSN